VKDREGTEIPIVVSCSALHDLQGEVIGCMEEINTITQEVKNAMVEQSSGAEQIAKAIEEVGSIAQQSEQAAKQSIQATSELSIEAQALDVLATELTK